MQHYFVNERNNDLFIFDKETSHHLINVLRMRNNDNIICVFEGEFYKTSVEIIDKLFMREL